MTLYRKAYAKVNWTLDILGRRDDGYHLMDMVMQSLSLCDDMQFTRREDGIVTLKIPGSSLPADDSNLVLRAARALQSHFQCPCGADIVMEKHIPMGAGLGGGSADAACTIHALCDLWQLQLSPEEKCRIGLTLGADVPYCLHGVPARVTGIGEGVQPIAALRSYPMVLLQPCDALSTKEAFRHFDETEGILHPDNESACRALAQGDSAMLAAACKNVMQHASELLRPKMADAIRALRESGAFLAQMTGSGSVVYGVYETEEAAKTAHQALSARFDPCILCHTLL